MCCFLEKRILLILTKSILYDVIKYLYIRVVLKLALNIFLYVHHQYTNDILYVYVKEKAIDDITGGASYFCMIWYHTKVSKYFCIFDIIYFKYYNLLFCNSHYNY